MDVFYRYRLSICTLLMVLIVIIQDIDYSRHVYTLICSVTYMTFFGDNFSGVGYISVLYKKKALKCKPSAEFGVWYIRIFGLKPPCMHMY